MAIQSSDQRRICALGHFGEDVREVPGRLVLVENQRQSQAIGHSEVILPQLTRRHTVRTRFVRIARSIVSELDTTAAMRESWNS
jgi:hypothetical protein